MEIKVIGGTLSQKEINTYVMQLKEANPDKEFKSFEFTVDGDYVDVNYTYDVGTLDRFNNAKRTEVEDRVKHGITDCSCSLEEIA